MKCKWNRFIPNGTYYEKNKTKELTGSVKNYYGEEEENEKLCTSDKMEHKAKWGAVKIDHMKNMKREGRL